MKRVRQPKKSKRLGTWGDDPCWYVTATWKVGKGEDRIALVLGPFRTKQAAEESIPAAQELAKRAYPHDTKLPQYEFGVAEHKDGHREGVLNDQADSLWSGEVIVLPQPKEG